MPLYKHFFLKNCLIGLQIQYWLMIKDTLSLIMTLSQRLVQMSKHFNECFLITIKTKVMANKLPI